MPCGNGSQSFKWLALAASQRCITSVPHGRTRVSGDSRMTPGFFLPSCVSRAVLPLSFLSLSSHSQVSRPMDTSLSLTHASSTTAKAEISSLSHYKYDINRSLSHSSTYSVGKYRCRCARNSSALGMESHGLLLISNAHSSANSALERLTEDHVHAGIHAELRAIPSAHASPIELLF